LPEFLPELVEPSKPRCFNLLVEHTKQLPSLDEAKMAERMTTAEMMREYNRMRLERGDTSASAPAAGSENPELRLEDIEEIDLDDPVLEEEEGEVVDGDEAVDINDRGPAIQ
jgi:hypothetical protein